MNTLGKSSVPGVLDLIITTLGKQETGKEII